MAVIAGLEVLNREGLSIVVYSDSQYVVKSVEEKWLDNWIATNFRGGKKNRDLWLRYWELSKKHQIRFVWIKGHAENPLNNRCDQLATAAADGNHLLVDEVFEKESLEKNRLRRILPSLSHCNRVNFRRR